MKHNEIVKRNFDIQEAIKNGVPKEELEQRYHICRNTLNGIPRTPAKRLKVKGDDENVLTTYHKANIYLRPNLKIGQMILMKYPKNKTEEQEHGEKKKCKVVSLHKWFVRVQDKYGIITGFSYWDIWKYGKY